MHYNLYQSDVALQQAVGHYGGQWGVSKLIAYGNFSGGEMIDLSFAANDNPPALGSHDHYGHRLNQVDYHPAYHQIMAAAIDASIHNLPWVSQQSGAQVVRAALFYLHQQIEAGSGCPLSMTFAAWPVISQNTTLAKLWQPGMASTHYDPTNQPITNKGGLTLGMAMTEKQGGSDVRANTTQARLINDSEQSYLLTGHKWFCSAPMSDGFLTLAQTPAGLSCFLLPRWHPAGYLNSIYIQRLKNKVGNRANASSEIELREAYALLIGEPGRGIATILQMVALTRFDCALGASALMRQCVAQACHHAAHRQAFGKRLMEQPLMVNVLTDLVIEAEAALALSMRLAQGLDLASQDEQQQHFLRLATPIAKYWLCKRAVTVANEAQECLGGAGYIESSLLARLYREAPLNAIWEGCGNIQCLDVLRVLKQNQTSWRILLAELQSAQGANRYFDQALKQLIKDFPHISQDPYQGRRLVEQLALLLQGATLIKQGSQPIADTFCQARLATDRSLALGTLSSKLASPTLISRAQPRLVT
jgi:putative acyl-CoA dehydrogenase